MMVDAVYGNSSTLVPFVFSSLFNVTILRSPTSPVEFPTPVTTSPDSVTVQMLATVYDPSVSSSAPSIAVGLSPVGVFAANGTVTPLPSWMQVTFSNRTLLLASDHPGFFIVAVNSTSSAPDGTYQIAIAETLAGGHQVVVPLDVEIEPVQVTSMGMGSMSG
jgi:hypothetical protein